MGVGLGTTAESFEAGGWVGAGVPDWLLAATGAGFLRMPAFGLKDGAPFFLSILKVDLIGGPRKGFFF